MGLCLAVAPAFAAGPLPAIDAALREGRWEEAAAAAREAIAGQRASRYGRDLAAPVARLALAEAGQGRAADAVWHWQVAQNLEPGILPADNLRTYGAFGALLERNRLRGASQPPDGLAVTTAASRPHRLAGEAPELTLDLQALPVPKWLRVQLVIDADGRPRHPVVLGGSLPGMTWEVLEAVRGWRFEPVRVDGRPVAVFYQLAVNPPSGKPLSDLLPPEPLLTAIDGELRAGRWKEAQGKAWGFWRKSIAVAAKHGRPGLAAALALEALADAGIGKEQEAICRWQAAQTLDPEIYHADLSAYGAAGALLAGNRWGELLPALADGAAAEAPTRDRQPVPKSLVRLGIEGTVMVGAVVDERGNLRQPVVLSASHPMTVRRDMLEAGALEAVCAWSYHPATLSGRPVAIAQTVPFRTAARSSIGGLPSFVGDPRQGSVERTPRPEPTYGPGSHPIGPPPP